VLGMERPLVAAADGDGAARGDPRVHALAGRRIGRRLSRFDLELHVSDLATLTIDVNGFFTRVWRQGSGPKLGFLAGFGGLPRWMPVLDELAKSRTLIVPSLPGFPGGERGHSVLDSHLDWMLAVREILEKSELVGADLAGSSVGASLALEVA